MSFILSVNAVLALNSSTALSSEEKQALKNMLFVGSCYLKIQANHGTLSESEIEYMNSMLEQEKPKKEIRRIKPSPQIGATVPPAIADIMAPLDLDTLLGSMPAPAPAPAPAIPVQENKSKAEKPSTIKVAVEQTARKYCLDAPNETKCRARRYGPHIPSTKPKVYYEQQCNNKPEGEQDLCKTCQKYFNNKDDKDSHKRREWNGFVCGYVPDHTATVGGKWFQKKFPKGIVEETSDVVATTITATATAALSSDSEEEPMEESIAEESASIVVEEWRPYTLNGVFYAINVKNNKVYKADITMPTGKEMVMMDQYCGIFDNGSINAYVDEDEIDE